MKISTKSPQLLIDEIINLISGKKIRSWNYDSNKKTFHHNGVQYKNHIHFVYTILDEKGIIEFILKSDGNAFAESKAFSLLERMLMAHFEGQIEIIK